MRNKTTILRELLELSTVEVDMGIAKTEIEDTNYYLYAVLELTQNGYITDFTFAHKTSQEVHAHTLKIIRLTAKQESIISEHLLCQIDDEAKEDCSTNYATI